MADKKGMSDLLGVLERMCRDYRAMEYLLDHYHPEGDQWIRHLRDSRTAVESQVAHLFDEVRGILQSDQPDAALFDSLIKTLSEVTLLKPL